MITRQRGLAIRERQDIVYREMTSQHAPATAKAPACATKAPASRDPCTSDPVLLFRYSALTFNGHRIHYDRDYVTKVEGYPGLDLPRPAAGAPCCRDCAAKLKGGKAPEKFSYRGVSAAVRRRGFFGECERDGGRARRLDGEPSGRADHEGDGELVIAATL